jgi:hypothetical protein
MGQSQSCPKDVGAAEAAVMHAIDDRDQRPTATIFTFTLYL